MLLVMGLYVASRPIRFMPTLPRSKRLRAAVEKDLNAMILQLSEARNRLNEALDAGQDPCTVRVKCTVVNSKFGQESEIEKQTSASQTLMQTCQHTLSYGGKKSGNAGKK